MVKYKTSDQDTTIINTITTRITNSLDEWYSNASRLLSPVPQIRSYTNSFIMCYELETSTARKVILVKIRRNPKMKSLALAVNAHEIHANIPGEYNALCLVYQGVGAGHPNFTAIRPLTYIEEYFAIVMEEFPSRALRELIFEQRQNSRSEELKITARKSGELLRFFHEQIHSIAEQPYSTGEILADIESCASRLELYTHGRVTAASLMNAFQQKLATKDIQSIPFSEIHQDMTCNNVLYSAEGKVCLIDIRTKPGPIYSDLALLLIHPETFREQIFSGGRYFSSDLLLMYRSAILAGYFEKHPIDASLVNLFCAIRVLDKWTMHEELFHRYKRLKRLFTRPLGPLLTSYFDGLLNRYLQAIPD